MKTTISIENDLLHEADRTARRMRLTGSRFSALAVSDFPERQRKEQMLIRLNELYAKGPEPVEMRLVKGITSKVRAAMRERR
jgi:hypothetical protein